MATAWTAALVCAVVHAAAAPTDRSKPLEPPKEAPPGASVPTSSVRAAAETAIVAAPVTKPGAKRGQGTSTLNGAGGRPSTNGPKIPEALRKQLEKQLESRIERDITQ